MTELIRQLTPNWETEQMVWAAPTKTNQGGGGYFYSSVKTSKSVVANLQGKSGQELLGESGLGTEAITAANELLKNIFVEYASTEADRYIQIVDVLPKITIEDKNISSKECFKNAILFRISFDEVLSIAASPNFSKTSINPVLKNVLGLEKPPPPEKQDDCCPCIEEDKKPEDEIDEAIEGISEPPRTGPPITATGKSGCDPTPGNLGVPPMINTLIKCPVPKLKENEIVCADYKTWEDQELRENPTIRECTINQNKGDSKFVGSTIGPKKPPPTDQRQVDDGPCGDLDLIQSLPQAYQEILNKYGIKGLLKKAAQIAGMELPIDDIKEALFLAFLKQLDCKAFVRFLNEVIELTGVTDFWGLGESSKLLMAQIKPVVAKLPRPELEKLSEKLKLTPKYIGTPPKLPKVPTKMPQQIDDIVDVLSGKTIPEVIAEFRAIGYFDDLILSTCEKYKPEILNQIIEILKQINLDDIGSPGGFNFDFGFSVTIGELKGIDFSWLENMFGKMSDWSLPDFDFKMPTFGGATVSTPDISGISINWSSLWDLDFNSTSVDGKPVDWSVDINWPKFGEIDWSKLSISFNALSKIDLGKLQKIDFGVDIDWSAFDGLNFGALSKMFSEFGKIDWKAPNFDIGKLNSLKGIDFGAGINFGIGTIGGINIRLGNFNFSIFRNLFNQFANIDFTDLISTAIPGLGSLYDKLHKIVVDYLGFEIPDFSLEFLDFSKFQMVPLGEVPELPTVNFELSPTVDLMSSISTGIADSIMEAISQATLSILKSTIRAICESLNQGKIGDLDIGSLIAESGKASFTPARAKELKDSVVNGLKDSLPSPPSFGEVAQILDNLIDDISQVLKPAQAGALLLGEASREILDGIRFILDSKPEYRDVADALHGDAQINRLFSNVGTMVDKIMLTEEIERLTQPLSPTGRELLVDCPSPQEEYERTELKKEGIPDEEIEKQLERKKKRKKKKFSELADMLAKPADKLLDGVVPEDECTLTPSGRKKPSLAPKEPPVNDYLLKKAVDVIFDGAYMNFNKDVSGFASVVSVVQDSGSMDNDAFSGLAGVTQPEAQPGEVNVLTQAKKGATKKVVAPDLKGFFGDFAANNFAAPYGGSSYAFTIPNKTGASKAKGGLLGAMEALTDSTKKEKLQALTAQGLDAELASSNFDIKYYPLLSDAIDREKYNIVVKSRMGTTTTTVFDANKRDGCAVIPAVQREREKIYPTNASSFGASKDFNQLVNYSWKNGTGITIDIPTYHNSIFTDIIINAGKEVATSNFFASNILSLVDFSPQLSPKQKECGCPDPHLLDLEELKKSVIKEYEDSQCGVATAGSDEQGSASSLDAASVGGVISTIIRLYLIEFSLRSLFVLSKFPLEAKNDKTKILDSLIQSYFSQTIIDDLGKLDKAYSIEFQRQAILYHNKIAKDNGWSKTGDAVAVIDNLVSQQLRSVVTRVIETLGVDFGNQSVTQMFLEDWMPMFDLPSSEGDVRFIKVGDTVENISEHSGLEFRLDQGKLILERYITKQDKSDQVEGWDKGAVNVSRFTDIVKNLAAKPENSQKKVSDFFQNVSVGTRITYLPPMRGREAEFEQPGPSTHWYDYCPVGEVAAAPPLPCVRTQRELWTDAPTTAQVSALGQAAKNIDPIPEKAYNLIEQKEYKTVAERNSTHADHAAYGAAAATGAVGIIEGKTARKVLRRISPIPLAKAEKNLNVDNLDLVAFSNQLQELAAPPRSWDLWKRYKDELSQQLMDTDGFRFLYEYSFPLKRMVFMLMMYSSSYFTYNKNVMNLFGNTKGQLKSVFYTMLNVNDPMYEDETMKKIGGNKGLSALADNNEEIPGMDLIGMIAKTPLLILKGLAEIADPNISIAKKIHDGALLTETDIPMIICSLMALPVNILTPMFGGIGPPITPLGIAYLAADAGSSLMSPKEKELKKKAALDKQGINLNNAKNISDCPEPPVVPQQSGEVPPPPPDVDICGEPCYDLGGEAWLNIWSSKYREYDRELLKSFQSCAKITVDGLYGPQTTAALTFYGPPGPPPKQYPRGGAFVPPDCGPESKTSTETDSQQDICGEPCYELAIQVHANIVASDRRQYNRDLLQEFQRCAKIVVDGAYGPQTEAALKFYGPPNTPPKQYPRGGPFVPPDCAPTGNKQP